MDFWSRMLSGIADTILPKALEEDAHFCRWRKLCRRKRSCGAHGKISLNLSWPGAFRTNGGQQHRRPMCRFWYALHTTMAISPLARREISPTSVPRYSMYQQSPLAQR